MGTPGYYINNIYMYVYCELLILQYTYVATGVSHITYIWETLTLKNKYAHATASHSHRAYDNDQSPDIFWPN